MTECNGKCFLVYKEGVDQVTEVIADDACPLHGSGGDVAQSTEVDSARSQSASPPPTTPPSEGEWRMASNGKAGSGLEFEVKGSSSYWVCYLDDARRLVHDLNDLTRRLREAEEELADLEQTHLDQLRIDGEVIAEAEARAEAAEKKAALADEAVINVGRDLLGTDWCAAYDALNTGGSVESE